MKISSTASDLLKRRGGGGPPQTSHGDVNRNQKNVGSLCAPSKLGKRKSQDGTRDQPIVIDDDPIDLQERPTDQGPINKRIQIDKTIQDRQKSQAIHDLASDSTQSRWVPPVPTSKPSSENAARLSLQRLGAYNDILTGTIIDGICYMGVIRKCCDIYSSTSSNQQSVMSILRDVVIKEKDLRRAESQLLALPSLKRFSDNLKSAGEKNDFRQHMRRYLNIYLPDCPFEISGTNRYKMTTHEATIIARKPIKAGEEIKYLYGIRAILTEEEEVDLDQRGQTSSIMVTTRKKVTSSYLFGPVGWANHDCKEANARFTSSGRTGMKATAVKDIEVGEEITFFYAGGYFGKGNCKCLCKTCEIRRRNGWLSEDRIGFHPSPEASLKYEYQQERQEKLDDLLSTQIGGSIRSTLKCSAGSSGILKSDSDVGPVAWAHLDRCFEIAQDQVSSHSCLICEKHRKLYGYQWPKTKRKGRCDNEERVYSPIP